jgi:hypothetical protein
MTDQELQQYAGQLVEVRFIDGRTVIGELVEGEALLQLRPTRYTLKMPPANVSDGPTLLNIPSAGEVESVRLIEQQPEMID